MTIQQFFAFTRPAGMAVLLGAVLSGCGASHKEPEGANAPLTVPVRAAVARQTTLTVTKTYSGTLEGEEQANIVSKVAERITGVNAHVGSAIARSQVALTLDKSGASSQFYQAEAAFKNAEKNLERMKSLYGEGAISLQTLDGAQTAFDVAKANFDAARGTVELTTPIGGVVTAVNVSTGDLAMPGVVLMTVARINRMKVIFNMNEADIVHLAPGQTVSVYSEARPGQIIEGKISQISTSADVGSRTFEVKALFPNTRDGWFKPGMFCKVKVQVSARENALVVPTVAVENDGTTSRVYVLKGGRAFLRAVQAGVATDEMTEILQGVGPNDSVATVGRNNLKDSVAVAIVGS